MYSAAGRQRPTGIQVDVRPVPPYDSRYAACAARTRSLLVPSLLPACTAPRSSPPSPQDLATAICSNETAAGIQIYESFAAGGAAALDAGQALRQAQCDQQTADAITLAVTTVQAELDGNLTAIEAFFVKAVQALEAVGVPGEQGSGGKGGGLLGVALASTQTKNPRLDGTCRCCCCRRSAAAHVRSLRHGGGV